MIIAFLNQKGGVGKSTLSINAADFLRRQGQSVLLIDADPQGTTSKWAALRDETPFSVVSMTRPNMAKEIIDVAGSYDHVIIDGPPRAEALSRAIIIAAELVVLPIEPSGASDWASATTIAQVEEARVYKSDLKAIFLVSRLISGTVMSRAIREHVAEHGIPLLKSTVANRVAFSEALTQGMSIFEWAPRSDAAKEFRKIMKEIGEFYEQEDSQAEAESQATG